MKKFAEDELVNTFAFGVFPCHEEAIPFEKEGYTLSCVKGSSPSTMFTMKCGGTTVGKAICSYENGEMDTVGSTLENVEVAREWRSQGLGVALMEAVEKY